MKRKLQHRGNSQPVLGPKKKARAKGRPLSPRETHGTRVQFRFTCKRCGQEDTLPFVPKTTGEILCRRCAQEVFGDNWAHGRPVEGPSEYTITCSRCGRQACVPFKPNAGLEVLCSACYRGEEQPDKDRLARMKKVSQ